MLGRLTPQHRAQQIPDLGDHEPTTQRLAFQGLQRRDDFPGRYLARHPIDGPDPHAGLGRGQHEDCLPRDPSMLPPIVEIPCPHYLALGITQQFERQRQVQFELR